MNKGFTLIEVLIVLMLISLLFSVVLLVFKVAGIHGIIYEKEAEILRNEAVLFYKLKHQLESSENINLEKRGKEIILKILTPDGESISGLVDACYIYANNTLYYEEKLNGLKEKDFCTSLKNPIARIRKFKVQIFKAGRTYTEDTGFTGIPDKIRLELNNLIINAQPRFAEVLR